MTGAGDGEPAQQGGGAPAAAGGDQVASTREPLGLAARLSAPASAPSPPNPQQQQQAEAAAPPPPLLPVSSSERLRWSGALHARFVQAVERLGGAQRAKVGALDASVTLCVGRGGGGVHRPRSRPAHAHPLLRRHAVQCSPRTLSRSWASQG